MSEIYVYGIIRGGSDSTFDTLGVDRINPVQTIESNGLECLVSNYNTSAFENLSKDQLVKCLFAHQQVIEHVMQNHTVLPVKFGTFLNCLDEAERLLRQANSRLISALASIEGKVEVEVAATWDVGDILRKIGEEEVVARARNAILAKGDPTPADQIRLGQVVKACMDSCRESYRDSMMPFLQHMATDTAFNALVSDEMVMNVAFLMERTRQSEFDESVRQLDSLFQNEINFRVIGPLPPYSFSTVQIARISREQVDKALRVLNIAWPTSDAEVHKAYRRMAAKQQRNNETAQSEPGGGPGTLKNALDLLVRYCQAWNESANSEQVPYPSGHIEDDLFNVNIRRAGSEDIRPARFGKVPVA